MLTNPHLCRQIRNAALSPEFDDNPKCLATSMAIRISSTEFGKEVGRYQDAALNQPVVVTRNGRDRTVMISA